jgi:hypothetical protein
MRVFKDITGQRFGRLTALKPTSERRYASVVWLCQCDCGQQVSIDGKNLRRGDTRSCGCGLSDPHDTVVPVLRRARELAESGRFERWQDIAHRLKYIERLARVRPTLSRASLKAGARCTMPTGEIEKTFAGAIYRFGGARRQRPFHVGVGSLSQTAHRCRLACAGMVFPPSTLPRRRARKPFGSFCRHLRKN